MENDCEHSFYSFVSDPTFMVCSQCGANKNKDWVIMPRGEIGVKFSNCNCGKHIGHWETCPSYDPNFKPGELEVGVGGRKNTHGHILSASSGRIRTAQERITGPTGQLVENSNEIPNKCGRCHSPLRPVWTEGGAALKCSVTDCEWELSANEYAQILHDAEAVQKRDLAYEEDWDE